MTTEEQITKNVVELIEYLNKVDDENQSLAQFSAVIIQRDLNSFLSAKSKNKMLIALSSLESSIGGKGILDSAWSEKNLKQIKLLCFAIESSTTLLFNKK